MPLLDGKYEIVSQEIKNSRETIFKAHAPDGKNLKIIWYEFDNFNDEQQFEVFRKLIRKLRKENLVAVYDFVSRPGANYIAWLDSDNLKQANSNPKIENLLSEFGYSSKMADIRVKKNKKQIYYLNFIPEELLIESSPRLAAIPKKIKRDRKPLYGYALSAVLFLLALLITLSALTQSSNNQTIVLDNFLNMNVNQASKILKQQNLNVLLTPNLSDKSLGTVISMEPKAGSEIRPFYRTVHLSYAAPTGQLGLALVPNLLNYKFNANTSKILEERSLSLGRIYYIHSKNPENTILAQSKAAASQVEKTTAIDILVSSGPKPKETFIPNMIGMPLEEAIFFAGLSGLNVEKIYERSSLSPGTVIGQSLAAYENISQDTKLSLYISEGINGEAINNSNISPALLGLSLAEAKRIAPNYQFKISEINTSHLANGIVSQTPAVGKNINGNIINLVINNYIPPIAIPIPNISANIRTPEPRNLDFAWATENNISLSNYEVLAILADGTTISVQQGQVKGGEIVSGSWLTNTTGPVRFKLYLNGFQYSIEIIRN